MAFAIIWQGPGEPGSGMRTAWFAFAIVAYYTAYTLVSIPHSSLGASLSRDTHQRNQIFAARGVAQSPGQTVFYLPWDL